MTGLDGTAAKQEAVRLATDHDVSWQYIYEMTKDLRTGKRKKRSDAGRRTFVLEEGTDLWYAAQLVVAPPRMDPDLALLTAKGRGYTNLPSLAYFQEILRSSGLGKKQRASSKRAYRSWEAEYPLQLVQIDCTALKVRWYDPTTRRILKIEGVDKNHPQMDPTKIQVWQILLKDDHSRRVFLRYFTGRAITSTEMVRFMCDAYEVLGVPESVYTDQGGEFKGRHKHAAIILNKILANDGGYVHNPHKAGNAQATGKVENGHKWAEKMDRLIGVAESEGQTITLDMLNVFADHISEHYNNRIHRVTKETPMSRWHGTRIIVRKLPSAIIRSALLSQEFDARLDESMTVTFNGVSYRIPSVDPVTKQKAPFVDYTGKKIKVVVPEDIDVILVTLPGQNGKFEPENGGTYDVDKVIATADKAGEFKSQADSTAEDLKKRLIQSRKAEITAIKEKAKQTGEIAPVPHLNVPVELPQSNIHAFPHVERVISHEEIAAVVPVAASGSSLITHHSSLPMSYWHAVTEYADRFEGGIAEAKQFLLGIFPNTEGTVPSHEIEAAIDSRFEEQRPRLQAVGS